MIKKKENRRITIRSSVETKDFNNKGKEPEKQQQGLPMRQNTKT